MSPAPFDPLSLPSEELWDSIRFSEPEMSKAIEFLFGPSTLGIITGPPGSGKSTFLRSHFSPLSSKHGWKLCIIPASSNLTIKQMIGYLSVLMKDTAELKVQMASQSIDQLQTSNENQIQQVILNTQTSHEFERLESVFANIEDNSIIVFEDAESLFLPESRLDLIDLFGDMHACMKLHRRNIKILCLVQSAAYNRLLALRRLLTSTPITITVNGIAKKNAETFIADNAKRIGAKFSKSLTKYLCANLPKVDERIWPIALHAACKLLADESVKLDRTVTIRHVVDKGGLDNIIGQYVRSLLQEYWPDEYVDVSDCLRVIANRTAYNSSISRSEITLALHEYAPIHIHHLLNSLEAINLIRKVGFDNYCLSHSVMRESVLSLKIEVSAAEPLISYYSKIWRENNFMPDIALADELLPFLRKESLSTPDLLFLVSFAFHCGDAICTEWIPRIHHLIRKRHARTIQENIFPGGKRLIDASRLFTILCMDDPDTTYRYLHELDHERGGVSNILSDSDAIRAFVLAKPKCLSGIVDTELFSTVGAVGLRSLLRYLARSTENVSNMAVDCAKVWDIIPGDLKPDFLIVAVKGRWIGLSRIIELASDSDEEYVRSSLFDILHLLPRQYWRDLYLLGFSDTSLAVRRRALFSLQNTRVPNAAALLVAQYTCDSCSFVREACMEIADEFPCPAILDLVQSGLLDESDVVRESAVYASSRLYHGEELRLIIEKALSDSSPKVREAAFHLSIDERLKVDVEKLFGDLRTGSEALKIVTAQVASQGTDNLSESCLVLLERGIKDEDCALVGIKLAALIKDGKLSTRVAGFLVSADEELVAEAIDTLRVLKYDALVSRLGQFIFHPSSNIRERAVYAIAEGNDPKSVECLIRFLDDPVPAIRKRALYGLGRLRAKRAAHIILRMVVTPELKDAFEFYLRQVDSDRLNSL